MKYFALTIFATISSVFAQNNHVSEWFVCPQNSFISQIQGKAGQFIHQISLICNDGTQSKVFGTQEGAPFTFSNADQGFKQVIVKYETRIDALVIDNQIAGGPGGQEAVLKDGDCPANGVHITTDSDVIIALDFSFACPQAHPTTTDQGASQTSMPLQSIDQPPMMPSPPAEQQPLQTQEAFHQASQPQEPQQPAPQQSQAPMMMPNDFSGCTVCDYGNPVQLLNPNNEVRLLASALGNANPTFKVEVNAYAMAHALCQSKNAGNENAKLFVSNLLMGNANNRPVSAVARATANALATTKVGSDVGHNNQVFESAQTHVVSSGASNIATVKMNREVRTGNGATIAEASSQVNVKSPTDVVNGVPKMNSDQTVTYIPADAPVIKQESQQARSDTPVTGDNSIGDHGTPSSSSASDSSSSASASAHVHTGESCHCKTS